MIYCDKIRIEILILFRFIKVILHNFFVCASILRKSNHNQKTSFSKSASYLNKYIQLGNWCYNIGLFNKLH